MSDEPASGDRRHGESELKAQLDALLKEYGDLQFDCGDFDFEKMGDEEEHKKYSKLLNDSEAARERIRDLFELVLNRGGSKFAPVDTSDDGTGWPQPHEYSAPHGDGI